MLRNSKVIIVRQIRQCSTKVKEHKRRMMIDRFIRVDHAGEYGADRIYAGQMAVLGKDPKTGKVERVEKY